MNERGRCQLDADARERSTASKSLPVEQDRDSQQDLRTARDSDRRCIPALAYATYPEEALETLKSVRTL